MRKVFNFFEMMGSFFLFSDEMRNAFQYFLHFVAFLEPFSRFFKKKIEALFLSCQKTEAVNAVCRRSKRFAQMFPFFGKLQNCFNFLTKFEESFDFFLKIKRENCFKAHFYFEFLSF